MPTSILFNAPTRPLGEGDQWTRPFAPAVSGRVRAFHRSFPQYAPTPLRDLSGLAAELGLGRVLVKDESARFGLNAFKALGGSWAIARCAAERLGLAPGALTLDQVTSPSACAALGDMVVATCTDGNHGHGVAWTARHLGLRAEVRMPKGSDPARVARIRREGAHCEVTDLNYDSTVALVSGLAAEHGWVLVQDTAWEGYETIPGWIMEGYTTIPAEAMEQVRDMCLREPTHVFLQAGVGSYAAAVLAWFVEAMGERAPKAVVVEPNAADCFYASMAVGDGMPHGVGGDLASIMAGLACGVPSTLAWPILRDHAAAFMSCEDRVAANGMRVLAAPLRGDVPIISGESGASTAGALHWLMTEPQAAAARERLGLGADSVVLLISTEGDTCPAMWRDIVWGGRYGMDCR